MTTTTATAPTTTFASALRRLYFTRFAFAIVWAGLVFTTATTASPQLTVLLIVYPLFDAGSVLWQIRANPDRTRSTVAEWVNVVVSVIVAVALGVASAHSVAAALAVWGAWAIGAGIPQLIAAIRNRRSGGQVAQMLSGGISVFAGASFLLSGLQGSEMITGAAGYAVLGAVFFLISAIRLNATIRKSVAA